MGEVGEAMRKSTPLLVGAGVLLKKKKHHMKTYQFSA